MVGKTGKEESRWYFTRQFSTMIRNAIRINQTIKFRVTSFALQIVVESRSVQHASPLNRPLQKCLNSRELNWIMMDAAQPDKDSDGDYGWLMSQSISGMEGLVWDLFQTILPTFPARGKWRTWGKPWENLRLLAQRWLIFFTRVPWVRSENWTHDLRNERHLLRREHHRSPVESYTNRNICLHI